MVSIEFVIKNRQLDERDHVWLGQGGEGLRQRA